MRLALKLTLAFLVVGLAGVAFIAWLAGRGTQGEFQRFVFNQYRSDFSDRLADYYVTNGGWEGLALHLPLAEPPPDEDRRATEPGGPLTVTDAKGVVIVAGRGHVAGETITNVASSAEAVQANGETVGWIVAGASDLPPSPAEQGFVRRIQSLLGQAAVGAAALSLLLGLILARTLTRPIRQLTEATRRMAKGDLDQNVAVSSHDEIGQLAEAFNRMSSELSRSQAIRRRMTADIAHELRNPVSIMIGHADAIHEGVLPASRETVDLILDEALRLQRLIEDLRTLSLADAGELSIDPRPTALLDLLRQAARSFAPRAERRAIRLEVEALPDIPLVLADPERIDQVIRNIVDNSIRHTPDGGRILLKAAATDDAVRMTVEDTGPGFDEVDLPHVFERFYRADRSRTRASGGSGLGLSIARSIVEAHQGRLWAERQPGRGAIVVIELPRATERA